MKKQINHVADFHDAFGIENKKSPTSAINASTFKLRYNLLKEENEEYLLACKNNDLVEIADALGDIMYILCGSILSHGLQDVIEDIFEEIQRSNMSKLDNKGNPIYREDGKVLKSKKYFKPNIKAILKKNNVIS